MSINSSSGSTSTSHAFLTYSNRGTNPSRISVGTRQTYATVRTAATGGSSTGKHGRVTSGQLTGSRGEDDFEDVTVIPKMRILFFFSILFPCIGYYGMFKVTSSNRREQLWAIAMFIYALIMTVFIIVCVTVFVSLY